MKKFLILFLFIGASVLVSFAQLGIKAGVNMANEIKTLEAQSLTGAFNVSNLTGYQLGLVYQFMPEKSGLGCELGLMLSQKGSSFSDSTDVSAYKSGYTELNYAEVPFDLRYRLSMGFLGIYGAAGIYAGYALSGKTVDEISNTIQNKSYGAFADRLDYGYNLGAGLELFKKIQLGANWSHGLKKAEGTLPWSTALVKTSNSVFSVSLVYMFW